MGTKREKRSEGLRPLGSIVRAIVDRAGKQQATGAEEFQERGRAFGFQTAIRPTADTSDDDRPKDRDAGEATPRVFRFSAVISLRTAHDGRTARIWSLAVCRPASNDNVEW